MTGIREMQISFLSRNVGTGINKEHLEKIAEALQINDISELLEWK